MQLLDVLIFASTTLTSTWKMLGNKNKTMIKVNYFIEFQVRIKTKGKMNFARYRFALASLLLTRFFRHY